MTNLEFQIKAGHGKFHWELVTVLGPTSTKVSTSIDFPAHDACVASVKQLQEQAAEAKIVDQTV